MNGWDKVENQIEKGPVKAFWTIVCIGATCLFIVLGGVVLFTPVLVGVGLMDKVTDIDSRIGDYEWYHQQYESIKAIDAKIVGAEAAVEQYKEDLGPRSEWGREDKVEYNRLNSISIGLVQQRNDAAAEYNAKSKMINRNWVKPDGIPSEIVIDPTGKTTYSY